MAYECVTNRNRRIIPRPAFVCNWLALEKRREADILVLIPEDRRKEGTVRMEDRAKVDGQKETTEIHACYEVKATKQSHQLIL